MQFFYLFSFVVAASYAVALPQPAELSEKYSNNVDATLASGLEASDPFTKDAVSSENLASTIKNVGDGDVIIFEDGELAGEAIEDLVGDMLARYLRRNAYVNVALGRWEYESVNDILGLIKSNFSEDERSEEELKLTKKIKTYSDGVYEGVNALVDATLKIVEGDGSVIKNVKKHPQII
ncbi:hypothetical protein BASA60_003328 [Batrachochytrium salamandrivorans]|nr:hypothetical protein BASA60_003328 [Batrachochytrium salamandrivorans]